ncbi:DUF983 domain-containing protein [Hyphomicrobium sp.]|uniref:DUF983 domain-containing protein n=1 Tax=Hyphomicrobium sp. TaxID=82 RepID=UPI002E33EBD1|nr:DUF983 domain-containing protein [Hyphomicrobium sp.]HEX2842769.1 DUF983 domain-containing protein [Hyphomicrobium sp.]
MIEFDAPVEALPKRDIKAAMFRGWRQKCPACGEGPLYWKYLKVSDTCPSCGEELHHQRADDAPPYFTMVIVCHVIIAGVLLLEKTFAPPTWVHLVLWLPLTVLMSLWLLPRVKGSLVGLQWALRMHGFGGKTDDFDPTAPPHPH